MPDDSDRDEETVGSTPEDEPIDTASVTAADVDALVEEIERLRNDLDDFERDISDRTVHREVIQADLKRYIRKRIRTARARGWGPYLVLLYGTLMTIGAFYFLTGGWAILAMIVIWLSTLGLYVLMVIVGTGVSALGIPSRFYRWITNNRR